MSAPFDNRPHDAQQDAQPSAPMRAAHPHAEALWRRLRDAGIAGGERPIRADDTPWYLAALLGVCAWIAALCLFGFLFAMFDALTHVASLACAVGAVCCAIGLGLLRIARSRDFLEQSGIACSLVGQMLVAHAFSRWGDDLLPSALGSLSWLAVGGVALAMYRLGRLPMHRFLCGGIVSFALLALFDLDGTQPLPLAAAVLAWLSAALWWRTARFDRISVGLAPLAWAASAMAIGVLWSADATMGLHADDLRSAWPIWLRDLAIAPLLPVAAACVLARMPACPVATRRTLLTVSLLLALLWLRAPGVAVGAMLAIAGFALYRPALLALGLIGIAIYLFLHYWQLDTTLLEKATWLAGSGVALLLVRAIVPGRIAAMSPTETTS